MESWQQAPDDNYNDVGKQFYCRLAPHAPRGGKIELQGPNSQSAMNGSVYKSL